MTACVTPKHVGEANNPRENQKKEKPGTDSELTTEDTGQGVVRAWGILPHIHKNQ